MSVWLFVCDVGTLPAKILKYILHGRIYLDFEKAYQNASIKKLNTFKDIDTIVFIYDCYNVACLWCLIGNTSGQKMTKKKQLTFLQDNAKHIPRVYTKDETTNGHLGL